MNDLYLKLENYKPYVLGSMRIIAAYMMILHGTDKIFGVPNVHGVQELWTLMGIGALTQFIWGGLILIGLFTRVSAFLLSGEMAYAYFFKHASIDNFLFPILNHGEVAALFCFIFLYLVVAGPGSFALDNILKKSK